MTPMSVWQLKMSVDQTANIVSHAQRCVRRHSNCVEVVGRCSVFSVCEKKSYFAVRNLTWCEVRCLNRCEPPGKPWLKWGPVVIQSQPQEDEVSVVLKTSSVMFEAWSFVNASLWSSTTSTFDTNWKTRWENILKMVKSQPPCVLTRISLYQQATIMVACLVFLPSIPSMIYEEQTHWTTRRAKEIFAASWLLFIVWLTTLVGLRVCIIIAR